MTSEAAFASRVVQAWQGKTVLVLGDVILDEYVSGDARRISPEAPVPVVEIRARTFVPGGAANVAANIAALGCRALVVGVVGADQEAEHLRNAIEKTGVPADALLVDEKRPTTVKSRIMAQNQQIVRLDREARTPIAAALENTLIENFKRSLHHAHACILSDYGKGVVTARLAQRAIAACQEAGIPLLVDPKSLAAQALHGATLIKPNLHEAERLANQAILDEASFLEVGHRLASFLKGTAVLITRGSLGMSLFRHDAEPVHIAASARNVYDVTGAGDTVIGTLAAALAGGAPLEMAAVLANHSAAIVVEKLGTATATAEELMTRCRRRDSQSVSG